ncbi:hypothetical protein [Lactiplantibacillus songbeiensis]|uniref:Uncharacterized protein n=1 Tax=Lactiplantibacillus songbeiensis TaxID=2559920 RepID=A0ABW4BZ84_9LACO|nr:hypothetical protein [Lactiplantibacillus songbeiensis]
MFVIILSIMIAVIVAYLDGGGWITNSWELYQNYRHSHLSVNQFVQLLLVRR